MRNTPEAIVIGLGVNGAALVHELARRGVAVLGVDAGAPPHGRGSSHGRTRIIREAYYEGAHYVPLVQQARALWSDLEELSGTVLHRTTGALCAGPADGALVQGALHSAVTHGLVHELLDAEAVHRRFGVLSIPERHVAVYEPDAGMLMAEPAVRTLLELARGYGAELRTETRVLSWDTAYGDIVIRTDRGEFRAPCVAFAPGAWLAPLLAAGPSPEWRLPLEVTRQTSHWFTPPRSEPGFHAKVCPVTLFEYAPGRMLYTLPAVAGEVKAGLHHAGDVVAHADDVDWTVNASDERAISDALGEWMPALPPQPEHSAVCLYTSTPDGGFIIDTHPLHANVTLVSACSGHGFKFAPATAELAADLMLDGIAAPASFGIRRLPA